jgi:hypothetical protein
LASGLAKAAFLVTTESMLRKIFKPVWFLLALLFLLEAWLWDLFVPPIRALIERIGWQHIKERLGLRLVSLPHWLIVLIFVLPDTILFPVKLGGLWLVAQGHVVIGTGIFVAAKTLSLGITVLLFELCRARLLELVWFRWIYEKIEAARLWAQTQTEPIKRELRDLIQNLRSRLAPTRSHILRMMERLRDKMRRKRS